MEQKGKKGEKISRVREVFWARKIVVLWMKHATQPISGAGLSSGFEYCEIRRNKTYLPLTSRKKKQKYFSLLVPSVHNIKSALARYAQLMLSRLNGEMGEKKGLFQTTLSGDVGY